MPGIFTPVSIVFLPTPSSCRETKDTTQLSHLKFWKKKCFELAINIWPSWNHQSQPCCEHVWNRAKRKQFAIINSLSFLVLNPLKTFRADFFEESVLYRLPKGPILSPRQWIQFPLCWAAISLLDIILILEKDELVVLQPDLFNLNDSEFMQHEVLSSEAFKTKRNKVTAFGI